MYKITCHTAQMLAIVCATLVKEGVCFEADTAGFTITLTGGY